MANPIELENVRLFDVLRNTLSGAVGTVMGIAGDKLDLKGEDGAIMRFKHGEHFVRVGDEEAVAFREAQQAKRRELALANPKKKRKAVAPSKMKSRAKRSARRRG